MSHVWHRPGPRVTGPATRSQRDGQLAAEKVVVAGGEAGRRTVDLTEPVRGPTGGDHGHPGDAVELAGVGQRREPPHLDEHRPGHRHGEHRTAETFTDLGEDSRRETAVEAAEGGLVPVGDPLHEIIDRLRARHDVIR